MPDLQIPEHEHYREAIDSVRKRVPVPRDVWDTMQFEERAHAFTVSQVARTQVLQQVLDAIDKAVTTGTAITDFRSEVGDKLITEWGGEIPGRLETIFRTNIGYSYTEGRHAINSAPAVKDARPFWRFNDTDNDRECEICHECHGVILPADDPWWDTHHPLLHHRCECQVDALSPEEAQEEGVTDAGDVPEVEADEGFGSQPSSVGKDWAPDLTNIDPELREALEAKLVEFKSQLEPERVAPPEPAIRPEPVERKPELEPQPREEPKPETSPATEARIQSLLDEHEIPRLDYKHEEARLISSDGRVLFDKGGNKNSVMFGGSQVRAMKDNVLTHNHPKGTSLSPDDLYLAIESDLRQIRAVGRSQVDRTPYAYSFTRPKDGWPDIKRVKELVREVDHRMRKEALGKVLSGEMTTLQANAGHWNRVWHQVQKLVDLGYRKDKLKE